jgi:hypothetical protein
MPPVYESHAGGNADSMHTTQPNPTQPHRTSKPRGAGAPAIWIPEDAWQGFVEMRGKVRKPLTERAVALIVKELEKLRDDGNDVGAILDQSTRNNWQDVYPLRGGNKNDITSVSARTQRNLTSLENVKRRNAERFAGAS